MIKLFSGVNQRMEYLPYELIDLVCHNLTLKEMSNLLSVNRYFHRLIQQNHFYSFCRGSFDTDEEKYNHNLAGHLKYFERFNLCYPEKYNNNGVFERACLSGNLEILKLLIRIYPKIHIRVGNNYAFQLACIGGHLEIAKLLKQICHEYAEINVRANGDYAFRMACGCGNFEISTWLKEICPEIDVRVNDDLVFRDACEYGHLKMAKWLIKIAPEIKFRLDDDYGFWWDCVQHYEEIAMWLASICSTYVTELPSILYEIKN